MKIGLRLWILIIILGLSLLAIKPSFGEGVVVKSVDKNSELFNLGLRGGDIIKSINGNDIENKEDYSEAVEKILGGELKRIDITTDKKEYTFLINESLPLAVDDIPSSRIKLGLDLKGGSRALVQPEGEISDSQLEDLIQISRNRFNVYGLSDINIRGIRDLNGNKFMLVEVAGATPDDLETLISQQGKFEAKIGNVSVFTGGSEDISDVCRNDANCAGIQSCSQSQEGAYFCNFAFAIYLTEESAKRHSEETLKVGVDSTGQYLTEKLYLYVDEVEVDSLLISSGLRGQVTTQISIQGSGSGATREDAFNNAKESMNRLQTILITGSLPYKLSIVKLDNISPNLGKDFTKYLLIAGALSILMVSLIVFVRYRKFKITLAVLLTSFSELIIILGFASLIGWNLDLPSIAGILATIGTGVDQQVVIIDEAKRKQEISVRQKLKKALFVIVSAYLTALVSLLPLYWAAAGLFKGFAFTTIVGITSGVLITRPAFVELVRRIEEKTD